MSIPDRDIEELVCEYPGLRGEINYEEFLKAAREEVRPQSALHSMVSSMHQHHGYTPPAAHTTSNTAAHTTLDVSHATQNSRTDGLTFPARSHSDSTRNHEAGDSSAHGRLGGLEGESSPGTVSGCRSKSRHMHDLRTSLYVTQTDFLKRVAWVPKMFLLRSLVRQWMRRLKRRIHSSKIAIRRFLKSLKRKALNQFYLIIAIRNQINMQRKAAFLKRLCRLRCMNWHLQQLVDMAAEYYTEALLRLWFRRWFRKSKYLRRVRHKLDKAGSYRNNRAAFICVVLWRARTYSNDDLKKNVHLVDSVKNSQQGRKRHSLVKNKHKYSRR